MMDDYSFNQIKRMEQEATRRAREARQRAKPPQEAEKEPDINNKNMSVHKPSQQQKRSSFSFLNALDIKKLIGENSEQAMLLLLILILSHDNTCDEYLLYALIYIML